MRQVAAVKALAEHVAGRVHPSVADDPLTAARHRAFIAAHLAGGVAPFAALPVLLALGGAPSALEIALFGWLVLPILIAVQLSRTGDLVRAHLLSALALTGLAAAVAAMTGGLASFALPWLALAPLEAGLSGSRRAILLAALASFVAALGIAGLDLAGVLPAPTGFGAGAAVLGGLVAVFHAVTLALRAGFVVSEGVARDRENRARFELFAGSVSDLVTRHAANGAVTFASPAAATLLGVAPRDLTGQGFLERVHIADRPAFLHTLTVGDAAGPATVELRVRRESADRSRPAVPDFVWLEMRARIVAPGETDQGAPTMVAAFRDVSERKAHEEALLTAGEEADRANVAKTRFLATMSHELRTPLNAIIGFSEILADEKLYPLPVERRSEYAALIHQSGVHLLDVVNGILDMSKIETGCFVIFPEPCAAGPIVRHCVDLMALKAGEGGVRLTADIRADLPEVVADRRALIQILLNLLSNAIKFTPAGGAVAVDVGACDRTLTLGVRDTGVGVAPEHVGRLGEAFFQADGAYDRRRDGTGLGLSVVRGLIDLHGGALAIDSALGRGTHVTVALPLRGAAPRAAGARTVERPAFGRSNATPSQSKVKKRA